jgi:hypothetical protein
MGARSSGGQSHLLGRGSFNGRWGFVGAGFVRCRRRWCESTYRVGCGEAGERRRGGGWLMGSRGSDCAKGVDSGRWVAAGEGVHASFSGGACGERERAETPSVT